MSFKFNGTAGEVCDLIANSVKNNLTEMLEATLTKDAKPVIRRLAEDLAEQIIVKMEVDLGWKDGRPTIYLCFNDKIDTEFREERTIVKKTGPIDASN